MSDFICPFKNSRCNDYNEKSSTPLPYRIIPFVFSINDIIENVAEKELKRNKKYSWLFLLWKRLQGNF